MKSPFQSTVAGAHAFITALDLSVVMKRVVAEDEEIDDSSAEAAELAYRHFLLMIWQNKFGDKRTQAIVPSSLADGVWHAHLIFTKHYRQMCMSLVGDFVDHTPDSEEKTESQKRHRREHTRAVDESIPTQFRFVSEFIRPERASLEGCGCDTGVCDCDCG